MSWYLTENTVASEGHLLCLDSRISASFKEEDEQGNREEGVPVELRRNPPVGGGGGNFHQSQSEAQGRERKEKN